MYLSRKFKIPRCALQGLQQIALKYAGVVTTFYKSLQLHSLALILEQFQEYPDLIELMKTPSIKIQFDPIETDSCF
jgi:hypothetical protein